MKGYIYKYTFPNGKTYIGQTRRHISIRHKEHFNPSTGPLNPRFWKAYQELGEPKLEIIKVIENNNNKNLIDALNKYETEFIRQYKSTDPNYGYNIKPSGTTYCTDEVYLDDEFTEIWTRIAQEIYPNFYSVYDKIASLHHEDLNQEEKDLINSYLLENNLFSTALNDVMNSADYSINNEDDLFLLEEAIDFAKEEFNDECWRMINEYIADNKDAIIEKRTRHEIIQQLSLQGDLIKEYRSINEIREALSLTRTGNIMNVIKGRQKSSHGYIWRKKY